MKTSKLLKIAATITKIEMGLIGLAFIWLLINTYFVHPDSSGTAGFGLGAALLFILFTYLFLIYSFIYTAYEKSSKTFSVISIIVSSLIIMTPLFPVILLTIPQIILLLIFLFRSTKNPI